MSGIPDGLRGVFEKLGEPLSPEQALWRAVVERVALDSVGRTGLSDPDEHERVVRESRTWLAFGPNVEEVFDRADVEPGPVRRHALETRPLREQTDDQTEPGG